MRDGAEWQLTEEALIFRCCRISSNTYKLIPTGTNCGCEANSHAELGTVDLTCATPGNLWENIQSNV